MRAPHVTRRGASLLATIVFSSPALAQWTALPPLVSGRDGHASAVLGTRAFFAGGLNSGTGSGEVTLDSVEIFDAATNTWSLDSLSEARHSIAGVASGTRAYFAGGRLVGGGQSSVIDVYDSSTGQWSTLALSVARRELVATAVGDKIIFAGGNVGSTTTDVVDIYNTTTGAWTTHTLSVRRSLTTAVTVGNKALIGGGFAGIAGSLMTDAVDVYDDTTGTWSTMALSAPRGFLSATVVGQKALFAGGLNNSFQRSDVVDIYDDATGTWSTAALSAPRSSMSAATVGNLALFAGGAGGDTIVDIFDAATGTWSTSTLPTGRSWFASAPAPTLGLRVLFAGGTRASVRSDVVEVYDGTPPPIGVSYCGPAVTNSTGSPAEIEARGSLLVAANDVALTARSLPSNANGFFLASRSQGFIANPGGSTGNLCLSGAIGRYVGPGQIKNSGASGTFSLTLNLTQMPTPSGSVAAAAGETWNFQAWFRDSLPGGSATSNFTDGVSLSLQ